MGSLRRLLGAVLLVASPAFAQTESLDVRFGVWNALLTTAALNDEATGPSLWLDVHGRRGPSTGLLVRPGAGYRLTPWVSVWVGYGWMPVFDNDGARVDEHRVWQQAVFTRKTGAVSLQARTRIEQRFGPEAGVGHRAREFVRAGWTPDSLPFGLVVWDEIFVGLNEQSWGPTAGFDQNRLFTGVSLPIPSKARFEMGYLMVYANRTPNQLTHVLVMNVFVGL
ncbi:MAG: hypothetical protein ACI9MC_001013 [Kiritimatiellia bacterium]|jgi:hypothetical protein